MRHTAVSVGGTKPPVSHPITPDHAEANFKAALAKLSAAAEAGTAVIPHVELAALARALPAVILGERLPVWRLLAWLRALPRAGSGALLASTFLGDGAPARKPR